MLSINITVKDFLFSLKPNPLTVSNNRFEKTHTVPINEGEKNRF